MHVEMDGIRREMWFDGLNEMLVDLQRHPQRPPGLPPLTESAARMEWSPPSRRPEKSSPGVYCTSGMSISSLVFDLCMYYQNAVECLKQCDCIISSLKHQLTAKDERISILERSAAMTRERVAPEPPLEEKASKNERIAILEDQLV